MWLGVGEALGSMIQAGKLELLQVGWGLRSRLEHRDCALQLMSVPLSGPPLLPLLARTCASLDTPAFIYTLEHAPRLCLPQEMFASWPFFRVTLDMLEMVFAKADPRVVKMCVFGLTKKGVCVLQARQGLDSLRAGAAVKCLRAI